MTNIFEILKKDYAIIEGIGETGGYHGQMLFLKALSSLRKI